MHLFPFSLLFLFLPLLAAAADKPNVILIYSDDHGWADLGALGADRDIRTPHRAIHLRIHLGEQSAGLRLSSIELRPARGEAVRSDFSSPER